jgi:hypothetical protein
MLTQGPDATAKDDRFARYRRDAATLTQTIAHVVAWTATLSMCAECRLKAPADAAMLAPSAAASEPAAAVERLVCPAAHDGSLGA